MVQSYHEKIKTPVDVLLIELNELRQSGSVISVIPAPMMTARYCFLFIVAVLHDISFSRICWVMRRKLCFCKTFEKN
jgi:hypothetical protein